MLSDIGIAFVDVREPVSNLRPSRPAADRPRHAEGLFGTFRPQHRPRSSKSTERVEPDSVRKVIAAGKDVCCEWPLTVDTATAADLLEKARTAGVRHVVGLQRRLGGTGVPSEPTCSTRTHWRAGRTVRGSL